MLQMTAGLGAAGALGLAVDSGVAVAATSARPGWDFVPQDQNLHLLRRATFGPTPASLAAIEAQGRGSWLDTQLDPASINDSECQTMLTDKFRWLNWSIGDNLNRVAKGEKSAFMVELSMATIARSVWSRRQLYEVMCEFWSNHLHITSPADKVWFARHNYDTDVIRANALGRFEDMLVDSARHPAMLIFLNNAESTKDEPNENYGRELLELHTVGLDVGYSERDMYDSSLIMTGMTVNDSNGQYVYDTYRHHTGQVRVLEFDEPNGSAADGEQLALRYLRYLANHPATARHIAKKLCERFVSDTPDDALVTTLAQVYLDNGTSIAPVLRRLFLSEQFAASVGAKLRRPYEDVIATLRILDYKPEPQGTDGLRGLHWMCMEVGQAPFAWGLPDGYPDDAVSWLSGGATLNRWNRHLSLAAHWAADSLLQPPLRSLLPDRLPRTFGSMLDALARRLVFRTLEDHHKAVILRFLGRRATDPFDGHDADATYRMACAVALTLDSPYHGVR